jgi:hypothetical protein
VKDLKSLFSVSKQRSVHNGSTVNNISILNNNYQCVSLSILRSGKELLLLLLFVISFMQGIYPYIPPTNHVSREYSVTAILQLLFMVHIALFPILQCCTFKSVYYSFIP